MRRLVLIIALVLASAVPGDAAGPYDGEWVGQFVASPEDRDSCRFSQIPYRVRITDGSVVGTTENPRRSRFSRWQGRLGDDGAVDIWARWERGRGDAGQAARLTGRFRGDAFDGKMFTGGNPLCTARVHLRRVDAPTETGRRRQQEEERRAAEAERRRLAGEVARLEAEAESRRLEAEIVRLEGEAERRRGAADAASAAGAAGAQGVDFGDYHALVIGNDVYANLPDLKTAVADARAVAAMLRDSYGFRVKLMTDASRDELIDVLDEYREAMGQRDNLLIYYAGHGWLDDETGRGYWLPVDAKQNRRGRWLSNADITDTLKSLLAKHILVVADSCYSGTLTRGAGIKLRGADYWRRMAQKRTRVALTSGGLEPVVDKGGGGHSPFAKALLDALGDNPAIMDATQLFTRMRRPVMLNADQTPQYADVRNAGHDGDDFLFVRKPATIKGQRFTMAQPRISKLKPPATPVVGVFPANTPGSTFKDCDSCPEMVVIPAGSFTMGSNADEVARENIPDKYAKREGPRHQVKIDRPFAIGKYEVTRNQFSVFASETGRGAGGGCEYFAGRKWQQSDSKGWNDPGFHQTGSDPVTCVSWNDAQAYLNWLSRKTGRLYRLPSESEWEYAARANTETARYWGNDTARACGYANLHDQTGNRVNHFKWTHYDCDDGYAQTAPVGRFQANAFGLHDILGNIVELIEDCLHENYEGAPTDGSAWVGGTDCARRMVRGGFWILNPWFSRSAFRGSDKIDFRRSSLGFRAALTVPTPR